ncbi:MAG: superoxide dismutase family protein [marine benthic group bacterium]|jgi:Cu-Zn family superoxide dismutase|nr:superoxide dismutase family protein [Gemmatimonadota bacterium]MCL7963018.1 superoxide dismutase family protein [Candidatus Carthagonibacter metallireducens]MCL7938031.1 superoxide dismutase family protein [Gemmatimonadota bacterium]MCL7965876.1 superoxide dismutase family protein [Gemmatimonadota bacterium]MCL7970364.1 superoxide dismutase family protein [Gemmatimonadota bacterium]
MNDGPRLTLLVGSGLVLAFAACSPAEEPSRSAAATVARAEIRSCEDGSVLGEAIFRERPSDEGIKLVDVSLEVSGLSDGAHAVHVHETAACEPCSAAGGHHDPGPFGETAPDAPDFNHPFHGGDLLNLDVRGGSGSLVTTTNRFTLSDGRMSLFDADGSSVIVHSGEDTYCDQEDELTPGCAGGARDACGIIRLSER